MLRIFSRWPVEDPVTMEEGMESSDKNQWKEVRRKELKSVDGIGIWKICPVSGKMR